MAEDSKIINIRIENADIWASGWITYSLYRLVDKGWIRHLEIKRVSKSEHSIELEILAFLEGYIASEMLDITIDKVKEEIKKILQRWKDKRRQTNLKMFLNDSPID